MNYTSADGSMGSVTQVIGTNGQNFLGITGTNGEIFTNARFLADPSNSGIGKFKQLRLGGVAAIGAVPEPSSWAFFLLGLFWDRQRTSKLPPQESELGPLGNILIFA